MSPPAPVVRQCPRCGYDLSGVITSWHDQCPMRGTCSECGLEFAWSDIFSERLAGPGWSFEHGLLPSPRRWWGTVRCIAIVPGPWRELRMELPIKTGRLFGLALSFYAVVHLAVALAAVIEFLRTRPSVPLYAIDFVPYVILPYVQHLPGISGEGMALMLGWGGVQWFVMSALMLILDETFRRVKVRRVHLLRGACYSMVAWCGSGVLLVVGYVLMDRVSRFAFWIVALAMAAPTPWLWAWWYSFVKGYLKLPRAGVIVSVFMLVTLLASLTAAVVVRVILAP